MSHKCLINMSHKNKHLCKISFSNDIWFLSYVKLKFYGVSASLTFGGEWMRLCLQFFLYNNIDNLFDKGWVTYRYLYAMRHNDALRWGVGGVIVANVVLKMRKVIKFRSSWIVIYYKIQFRFLLQHLCTDEDQS